MAWTEAPAVGHPLEPSDVHVWRFPLNTPLDSAAERLLPEDERDRAAAMQSPDARRSFVASQTALRELLAAYTGLAAREIELARAPRGKPELAAPRAEIRFNVSHSGDWGVIAIARVEVGVDVEQLRPRRASQRLADRFFTAGERELLRSRSGSEGDRAFFTIWSRKEAYLKAVGFGLSAPFSQVDSSADRLPDLDAHGRQTFESTPWGVQELLVDETHPATVVARAEVFSLRCLTLRRSDD